MRGRTWWIVAAAASLLVTACASGACGCRGDRASVGTAGAGSETDEVKAARAAMVGTLVERGIDNPRVLDALRTEPRQEYVPPEKRAYAYDDAAVQIGWEQTISRPYVVAEMTSLLDPQPGQKVLEIGTGSGYQAAILDRLGVRLYSIEIVEPLCRRARADLDRLGHGRVQTRCGDGYAGWPEATPFDRVILTAAPDEIPQALIDQLAPGGRLVAPVGDETQNLVLLTKDADGTVHREEKARVSFVPMVHADRAK